MRSIVLLVVVIISLRLCEFLIQFFQENGGCVEEQFVLLVKLGNLSEIIPAGGRRKYGFTTVGAFGREWQRLKASDRTSFSHCE